MHLNCKSLRPLITIVSFLTVVAFSPAQTARAPETNSIQEILLCLDAGDDHFASNEPATFYLPVDWERVFSDKGKRVQFSWDLFVPAPELLNKLKKNPRFKVSEAGGKPGTTARIAGQGGVPMILSATDPIIGETDNYCRLAERSWGVAVYKIQGALRNQRGIDSAVYGKKPLALFECGKTTSFKPALRQWESVFGAVRSNRGSPTPTAGATFFVIRAEQTNGPARSAWLGMSGSSTPR